jgi:hypothetical protein
LPEHSKVTKQDAEKIANAAERYNRLNNEQKRFVGDASLKHLNEAVEALRKLLLYDAPTDMTVAGIDGTTFSPDVYLVVTPIEQKQKESKANFVIAAEKIEKVADITSELQNKELVALYDVSMFKGNTKIQPDGKVQVKIKIPDNLKDREGLDIIHVADDGTVTVMHATRDGDYLIFVTDHFSEYGIIAANNCWLGICNALGIYNSTEGVCYCWIFMIAGAILLFGTVYIVYKRSKRKKIVKTA